MLNYSVAELRGKRKITYLRNLRNTTIEVIFVKDVILLILQLKIMDGLMK